MGGLTFNIGSLGMFADMMATGIARNNATGQAGKFGEIAQKLEGKGILEINIGSNGITGKFGMGGFDLAGSLYTFGKRMSDKASLKSYAMQERVSQEEAEAAYWAYVYGDWTQENTIARISSGVDVLHIVDEMTDGANAQTVQNKDGTGRVITMKDTGDVHKNAITLGHESYRDGIVGNKADQQRETFNAVLGHTLMEARMLDYGQYSILEDENIRKDLMEYAKGSEAFAEYVNGTYDSSVDYWKFTKDGNIIWDGKDDLFDEDGNLLHKYSRNDTGHTDALAEALGITYAEAREMLIAADYKWENGTFVDENGNDVKNQDSKAVITGDEIKARYDFQHNYVDKVWDKYGGSMIAAIMSFQNDYVMDNQNIRLSDDFYGSDNFMQFIAGMNVFATGYDKTIGEFGNVGDKTINYSVLEKIANDFDEEIFSDSNSFYKYAKEINPVVGFYKVTTQFYYYNNVENPHINLETKPNTLAIDFSTNNSELQLATIEKEKILVSSSFGYNSQGGYSISTYTDLFRKRYVHLKNTSQSFMSLYNLTNNASNQHLWSFTLPSNYNFANVAGYNDDHGSLWTAPHSHLEYTRIKK